MPFELRPDDYKCDWDLLAAVAREWSDVCDRFQLRPRTTVPQQRIRPHTNDILSEQGPWPGIRRVRRELERDAGLFSLLEICCCTHRLKDPERRGYDFEKILRAVLFRIFWTVCRNAGTWHADRKPSDRHWLRILNRFNLTQELRRAVADLEEAESADPPEDAPDADPPGRPGRGGPGCVATRPEDEAIAFEEAYPGAPPRDVEVFRDWYANCGECTEAEEEAIARRHGLTRVELDAILRRMM